MIYNDEKFNVMPIHERCVNTGDSINNHFELIEEWQDIDIQSIEELDNITPIYDYYKTINELIKAVNQLDNKIKDAK